MFLLLLLWSSFHRVLLQLLNCSSCGTDTLNDQQPVSQCCFVISTHPLNGVFASGRCCYFCASLLMKMKMGKEQDWLKCVKTPVIRFQSPIPSTEARSYQTLAYPRLIQVPIKPAQSLPQGFALVLIAMDPPWLCVGICCSLKTSLGTTGPDWFFACAVDTICFTPYRVNYDWLRWGLLFYPDGGLTVWSSMSWASSFGWPFFIG